MPLSPQDQSRFIAHFATRADVRAKQELQWVQHLDLIGDDLLAKREASPYFGLFWIRLSSVVAELIPKGREMYEFMKGLSEADRKRHLGIPLYMAQHEAALAIRDALSEDELIYLDYKRHCECHIHQDAYRLGIPKNKLRTTRLFRMLGNQEITIETLDQKLSAILRKYGVNENAIAIDFAGRLSARIKALRHPYELMHALG